MNAPMVPTPAELKAARLAKGISLVYVAERIALHPRTLREIENGDGLRAMPEILMAWRRILDIAPNMRSRRRFNLMAAGILVAVAFVTRRLRDLSGGR
jgi:transcriptional regulator with XRE-family HTH domain